MGVGSFRDVMALIDADVDGANFDDLDVTRLGRAYLAELGVNALELLPPADSVYNRQWGYGTTNYFAPDFEQNPRARLPSRPPITSWRSLSGWASSSGFSFTSDPLR